MQDEQTISNRQYLAFILAGGPGNIPFLLIKCTVDAAGRIVFSSVTEQYVDSEGGYIIYINGPEEQYEMWMGEGNEYVTIGFADPNIDPVPPIPVTPADVLESLQRWKIMPGVREIIKTDNRGMIMREYCQVV